MSNRETAIRLAANGFRVFPLKPKTKRPAFRGWQRDATADAIQVFEAWPGEHAPGVVTDGYAVLDFDAKSGGLASLETLRAKLPRTLTIATPSGGFHYWFRAKPGRRLASRAYRVDKMTGRELFAFGQFRGVDVRGDGGLVVGPGATVEDAGAYRVAVDAPIAELPDELADLAETALPPVIRERGVSNGAIDDAGNIARAIVELRHSAPAVEGNGGDAHTIAVANSVMDFGISPETCADLMLEHWNARCEPPWDVDRLAYKVDSAARSRRRPIGCHNADDVFDGIEGLPPEPRTPAIPAKLLLFMRDLSAPAVIADRERDLVRGLLGRVSFAVLYGDSGAGKSFLALDLSYALALGEPWQGRKVTRTAVLYVCAEGLDGFKGRALAIAKTRGDAGDWFAMLAIPVLLTKTEKGAQGLAVIVEAVRQLRAASGAETVAVIIDTLARVQAGGDENKVEDMMNFVEHRANEIQKQATAAVVVVHHTNKAGVIRGSSALYAAADLVLRADHDKAKGRRELAAEKVKDGKEGKLCTYQLVDVHLGDMADGEAVNSCVVKVGAPPAKRECVALARELLAKAIDSDVRLSPNNKAANFAAKWLAEHQTDTDFSLEEFAEAVLSLEASGYLSREEYAGRDKNRKYIRYALAGDEAFRDWQH